MSIDHLLSTASSYQNNGCLDLAESHYRAAIDLEPDHRDACFGLARLLIRTGRFDESVDWLMRLLDKPGDNFAVHRQLGFAHGHAGRLKDALDHFERVLENEPDNPATLHVVANFQQALGLHTKADATYRRAVGLLPVFTVPAAATRPDFRVLFVFGPGAGNTPITYLTEQAPFESNVFTLLRDVDHDAEALRTYADVVVNLISDADEGDAFLEPARALVERIGGPVINHPRIIAGTGRDSIAARLASVPGACVPQTRRYPAIELGSEREDVPAHAGSFPLLARPAGTHGGEDFERMEDKAQLRAFVSQRNAGDYYLTPFVDYRSDDGFFRKYRFIYVDGEIFPYHLAIDDKWKVHHATTRMADHPWMQAEEQAFLADPWHVFGLSQRATLQSIRETIGLDYFGIDCSLGRDGAVVVFEVNATMLVHGSNSGFPYKSEAAERIKRAFHTMLKRRVRTQPALSESAARH